MKNPRFSSKVEVEILHKCLFGSNPSPRVASLYEQVCSKNATAWAFTEPETAWLRKVLKTPILLAELAWLSDRLLKGKKRSILTVKLHALLYVSELVGIGSWTSPRKPGMKPVLLLAFKVAFKPIRLLGAGIRLWINV